MDKVKQRIIELCPDLLELKFGCEVETCSWKGVIIGPCLGKGWCTCLVGTDSFPYLTKLRKCKESELKVLGRKISLSDVLRAIDKNGVDDNTPEITVEGQFTVYNPETGDMHLTGKYWNLAQDSYDLQAQEVKLFVGKLLGI